MSRRLHPLTVFVRGGSRGLGFAVAGSFAGNMLGRVVGPVGIPAGRVLAALGLLVGVGYELARYRRFEYELTEDTLDIRSGVLARREREIPVRRIQNVDVSRGVLSRILGIATVNVETAGGGSTEAHLQYVGLDEARALQEGIRTRKRDDGGDRTDAEADSTATPSTTDGAAATSAGQVSPEGDPVTEQASGEHADATGRTVAVDETGTGRSTEATDEEVLFELDAESLLLVSALSFDVRSLSALVFLGPFLAPFLEGLLDGGTPRVGPVLVALALVGLFLLGLAFWALGAVSTFVAFYDFRLWRVGDELRYERGLLQRYDGSIPLEKVQTLVVEENLLMRQFGYAALAVETAGYAPGSGPQGGSEAAIPLASREDVLALAADLEGFEEPSFERPPTRARRRYAIRYGLATLVPTVLAFTVNRLLVPVPWYLLLGLLALAPLAARATWRHRGRALGEDHVFTRNGFWRRRTHVVPYYRVQTVIEKRTVFQRRWGLASVVIDTAGSRSLVGADARAVDVDTDDARAFAEDVADRFQAALVGRRRRDGDGASGQPTNAD